MVLCEELAFRDVFRAFFRMFRIALEALLRIFLTCRVLWLKRCGLKVNCGMYRTWSTVDKFWFSVNRLVVRTEFRYEEFII